VSPVELVEPARLLCRESRASQSDANDDALHDLGESRLRARCGNGRPAAGGTRGRDADLCGSLVARTIRFCVVLLTIAELGNASVAAQLL